MRVAFCSDLHLERSHLNFELPDADVLILAGDICVRDDLRPGFIGTKFPDGTREFFREVSAKYDRVLYVPGNHEHWSGELTKTTSDINAWFASEGIRNVTCEDRFLIEIQGTRFILATLWTDMNRGSPLIMSQARFLMNDYSEIRYHGASLSSGIVADINAADRKFICDNLDHDRIVVVTHHAPSTIGQTREHSDYTYFYYNVGLEDMILDNPQITHWIHAHTHERVDYMLGETRVRCNPRGYLGIEKIALDFQIQIFDV